ncbi:MAG TPA: sulfur carrier protein ThiS [Bacteroidales bacterium]|nr:sulfur carrier protein ThiS [Bacteroidales bacterium]
MDITLNNLPESIETNKATITVTELLAIKRFTFKMLVVKVNGKLIKKDEYSIATIKDGDDVQVIHLISGG